MRACDARSAAPRIGSNIGGGPDILAEALAGETGAQMLDAITAPLGLTPEDGIFGFVERTCWLDEQWMAALETGVTQFVILAAGLDARAWRLPRLSSSVTVFEVDVPLAMAYKAEAIGRGLTLPLRCRRVVVEADLSDARWAGDLCSAGFDPRAPSFFLVEGLLQYLPPHAPAALLRTVATLMAPGSTVAGDCCVSMVAAHEHTQRVLRRFGTRWSFDVPNRAALGALLAAAGLRRPVVVPVRKRFTPPPAEADSRAHEAWARETARQLGAMLLAFEEWPLRARRWVVETVSHDPACGVAGYDEFCIRNKHKFRAADEVGD